jgi:hypothetical protein
MSHWNSYWKRKSESKKKTCEQCWTSFGPRLPCGGPALWPYGPRGPGRRRRGALAGRAHHTLGSWGGAATDGKPGVVPRRRQLERRCCAAYSVGMLAWTGAHRRGLAAVRRRRGSGKDGNGYPWSVCPRVKNLLGTNSGTSLYPRVRVRVAFDIHGYLQNG